MEELPLNVVQEILSHVDLREKFLLMSVSHAFEAACRSLVAGQRILVTCEADSEGHLRDKKHALFLPHELSEDLVSRFWLSLRCMQRLTSLTICVVFVFGHEAAVDAIIAANASHLRELRFTDDVDRPTNRPDSLTFLHQVSLPKLRVIDGCRSTDAKQLVANCPLLQEVSIRDRVFARFHSETLVLLSHLQVITIRVPVFWDTDGLLTLMRGASRPVLREIQVTGIILTFDQQLVDQELELIEGETARRPLFRRIREELPREACLFHHDEDGHYLPFK